MITLKLALNKRDLDRIQHLANRVNQTDEQFVIRLIQMGLHKFEIAFGQAASKNIPSPWENN